jgi:hypothetical protein
MAMRAAEEFTGKQATIRDGNVYLGDRLIPTDKDRNLIINYAGPPVPSKVFHSAISSGRPAPATISNSINGLKARS